VIESVDLPGELWEPFMPLLEEGEAVDVEATLTLPPTNEPVPVVILTHGCGGPGDAELGWVSYLEGLGIGSLLVDHLGGRDITTLCFGAETLNVASILVDVYRAADSLEGHPHVDIDNLAVMGLSLGGRTALWSAVERFEDLYSGRTFQGHIALYPSACFIELEDEHVVTGAPIRILHGTADDWTPIDQCHDYVDRMLGHGVDIRLIEYVGAPHSFDNSSGPTPAVEIPAVSPRNCTFVERGGSIVDVNTGAVAGVRSTCVEIGAHYGFDAEARDAARADVADFLDHIFDR